MESWERRCWQCIILGYFVVPLILLRLPITREIGDSRAQYCTTVLFAWGRAMVDMLFMQLLGGKAEVELALIVWPGSSSPDQCTSSSPSRISTGVIDPYM